VEGVEGTMSGNATTNHTIKATFTSVISILTYRLEATNNILATKNVKMIHIYSNSNMRDTTTQTKYHVHDYVRDWNVPPPNSVTTQFPTQTIKTNINYQQQSTDTEAREQDLLKTPVKEGDVDRAQFTQKMDSQGKNSTCDVARGNFFTTEKKYPPHLTTKSCNKILHDFTAKITIVHPIIIPPILHTVAMRVESEAGPSTENGENTSDLTSLKDRLEKIKVSYDGGSKQSTPIKTGRDPKQPPLVTEEQKRETRRIKNHRRNQHKKAKAAAKRRGLEHSIQEDAPTNGIKAQAEVPEGGEPLKSGQRRHPPTHTSLFRLKVSKEQGKLTPQIVTSALCKALQPGVVAITSHSDGRSVIVVLEDQVALDAVKLLMEQTLGHRATIMERRTLYTLVVPRGMVHEGGQGVVKFLQLFNELHYQLPAGAMQFKSWKQDTITLGGKSVDRARVFVEVHDAGVSYLESRGFTIRGLTSTIKLNPSIVNDGSRQ